MSIDLADKSIVNEESESNESDEAETLREVQSGYVRNAMFPSCAVYDMRVSDAMLRVLAALGTQATQFNRRHVYANQQTVAQRLGMTRQALGKHVLALEELGYIAVRRTLRKDGGNGSNKIRMIMDIEVGDEHMRQLAARPREGIGGRHKKSVDDGIEDAQTDELTEGTDVAPYRDETADDVSSDANTPVNLELTGGMKLGVDGGETQLVSGPETQLVDGGETQLVSGPETQLVSAWHRGTPAANAENSRAGDRSRVPILAAHTDLLSGSSNRIFQQERAAVRAPVSPARVMKTGQLEAPPANVLVAMGHTTLGAKEAQGVWRDVVNEIHVNVTIKVWYFERARLYRLADGGWLLLGHNFMAESQLKRFYSGIELLLRRHTKGQVVRLTIRDQAEVRAAEEVLV